MHRPRWIIDEEKTIAVATMPKCGMTSFRAALRGMPVINSEAVSLRDDLKKIMWIRSPLERLVSGYSFFKAHHERGGKTDVDPKHTESWNAWVDNILVAENPHWEPQVNLVSHNGEFLPDVVHRFDDLAETWGYYFRGLLPRINGCVHEPITVYREQEISEKYLADSALWGSALLGGKGLQTWR